MTINFDAYNWDIDTYHYLWPLTPTINLYGLPSMTIDVYYETLMPTY